MILYRSALEKAEVLLKINRSIVKLDNVWGVGGGNRPVKFLTSKVIGAALQTAHTNTLLAAK